MVLTLYSFIASYFFWCTFAFWLGHSIGRGGKVTQKRKITGYRIGERWRFEMTGASKGDLKAALDWIGGKEAAGDEVEVVAVPSPPRRRPVWNFIKRIATRIRERFVELQQKRCCNCPFLEGSVYKSGDYDVGCAAGRNWEESCLLSLLPFRVLKILHRIQRRRNNSSCS